MKLGIPQSQIEGVNVGDTPFLNTLIESEALIKLASSQEYTSLLVVAAPFHQTRAFMTAATVATRNNPALRIYSFPGKALPWQEKVSHSQGTVISTRKNLIHSELERIRNYQKKGDLASVTRVLEYLDYRDTALPLPHGP